MSQPEKTPEDKTKEEDFDKFIYGHPTINGKETIYMGKKFKKKSLDDDNYNLRSAHTVLSNILQIQMEKNKKQLDTMNLRKYYSFDDDDNDISPGDNDNNNDSFRNSSFKSHHAYSEHRGMQNIQRVDNIYIENNFYSPWLIKFVQSLYEADKNKRPSAAEALGLLTISK